MMSTLSGCDHLNHHFSFSESEEWLKEKSGLYETPLSPVLSSGTHYSISGLDQTLSKIWVKFGPNLSEIVAKPWFWIFGSAVEEYLKAS